MDEYQTRQLGEQTASQDATNIPTDGATQLHEMHMNEIHFDVYDSVRVVKLLRAW